jgi:hypothetical protein
MTIKGARDGGFAFQARQLRVKIKAHIPCSALRAGMSLELACNITQYDFGQDEFRRSTIELRHLSEQAAFAP